MKISFTYNKAQVQQALRYHFISRPENRIMIIVVNVFALFAVVLFYFKKVTPLAVLTASTLWFVLMITFWFLLPGVVYRRSATFLDHFTMNFEANSFSVGNERGERSWPWKQVAFFKETPHFFHLYFDRSSFFLVPKTAFASGDEIYEMRQLLKQKLNRG